MKEQRRAKKKKKTTKKWLLGRFSVAHIASVLLLVVVAVQVASFLYLLSAADDGRGDGSRRRSLLLHDKAGYSGGNVADASRRQYGDAEVSPWTTGGSNGPVTAITKVGTLSIATTASGVDENGYAREGTDEGNETRKPLLVLHIGPHKTASSELQCELAYVSQRNHDADDDNPSILFLGRTYRECLRYYPPDDPRNPRNLPTINTRWIVDCLDGVDGGGHERVMVVTGKGNDDDDDDDSPRWRMESCVSGLEGHLEAAAKLSNRTVVMISDEAFSRLRRGGDGDDDFMDSYRVLFSALSRHHRVRVSMVYRRFYEWLVSNWDEAYKPHNREIRHRQ